MRQIYLFLIIMALFSVIASAIDYYADVEITVDNAGFVSIKGETNHPGLEIENSPEYTSKNGRMWLLNITLDERFSDYIFALHLPENSEVNYIKTPQLSRIEDDNGITIVGIGEDDKFFIVVQYHIKPIGARRMFIPFLVILLSVIIIISAIIIYRRITKNPKINYKSLTERQQIIVKLVMKNDGRMTQADIEKQTGLPKSSVSRNIETLSRKEVIKKEQVGISNIITINSNGEKPTQDNSSKNFNI